jgi:hypothetical protein
MLQNSISSVFTKVRGRKTKTHSPLTTLHSPLSTLGSSNPLRPFFHLSKEDKSSKYVQLAEHLAFYALHLPNPTTLYVKKKVPNEHVFNPVFGVDPSSLLHVLDEGFWVPKVLVILRDALLKDRGTEEVGIFRLAGSNPEMEGNRPTSFSFSFPTSHPFPCSSYLLNPTKSDKK